MVVTFRWLRAHEIAQTPNVLEACVLDQLSSVPHVAALHAIAILMHLFVHPFEYLACDKKVSLGK